MDISIQVREDLVNWGRWLRSQPDPSRVLNYPACPMFREYKPKWREYDDESSARASDAMHNPDAAEATDRMVRMLANKDHQVYLYAYFAQWQSMPKIAEKFEESRRNVELRLTAATSAYEQKLSDWNLERAGQ